MRSNTHFHLFSLLVLHFQVSLVIETHGSPFSMTSESNLYSTTAQPKSDAYNQSMNETDDYVLYVTGDIVYILIISCLEIPMICLSIYAVYSLTKSKQAPVFVLNLLISDLIQTVCMLPLITDFNFYWTIALIFRWK